jgi:glycosyltransferase involved in cell wall biosynthesis
MSFDELTETRRPDIARGRACVVIAANADEAQTQRCLESVAAHTPPEVPVTVVSPSVETVNRALELSAPADVVLLSAPCVVSDGWLEALRAAAHEDTTTASASALATDGSALAIGKEGVAEEALDNLASSVAERSLRLRPRLGLTVGPCIYLRRDALELVGPLDEQLALRPAIEVDFAQRCLLTGLAHVVADDVVIAPLGEPRDTDEATLALLREKYPHLSEPFTLAASTTLFRALEVAKGGQTQLSVTVDARALDGAITGTQRHILELLRALAENPELRLRLLVGADTNVASAELLGSLAGVELLSVEEVDEDTTPSTVFHRPQQAFEPADMRLALRLGERIVLSQLDLIAYRNPGYHASAGAWASHRRVTRQALAAADRVVVSSEHTRLELLSDGLVEDDRIRIVAPGLDHMNAEHRPSGTGLQIQAPLAGLADFAPAQAGHRDGFLLCLGTDFRHKNRLFALRMLAALRERHDWSGGLVLAGTHIPHGSSLADERDFVELHSSLEPLVRDLGAIGEHDKGRLMSSASAVLYPSVYEGFGLIPFEAALSGVPCAFASQSSLGDVLPREAASILPWDPQASAANLLELLGDDAARARHLELLRNAAASHTWAGAAKATAEAYREAALASAREAAVLSRDELERERELRELVAAQDALVARLVFERKHTQGMYDELHTEVGFGLGLIGPKGALPEDLQRALLALSARPGLSRPLYGLASRAFRLLRAIGRGARDPATPGE